MMDELVTITSYAEPIEADLIKLFLEQEGIRAFLENDNSARLGWHYAHEKGVRVLVGSSDAERARQLLADIKQFNRTIAATEDQNNGADAKSEFSSRELTVDKALICGSMAILFPPLILPAIWLLAKVIKSREPLRDGFRRKAWMATATTFLATAELFLWIWISWR